MTPLNRKIRSLLFIGFNLFLFTSFSSYAFFDEKADTQPINYTGDWNSYLTREFLKTPAGKMVSANQSEKSFVYPKTYREAILEGDAPISIIQELHRQSRNYWNTVLNSIDQNGNSSLIPDSSNLRRGIVISHLADLNLSASRLWNLMVSCNSQDPQKARIGFLHPDDGLLCSTNPGQSDAVLKQLKELALNWQTFIFGIEATDNGLAGDLPYSETYKKTFKNLHPLLTEFTLLIWSAYFNTFWERRSELTKVTGLALSIFNSRMNSEYKDALRFNSAVSLYQGTILMVYFMNVDDFEYPCGTYGLWPAFNQVLLHPEQVIFLTSTSTTDMSRISQKGEKICGVLFNPNWEDDATESDSRYNQSIFGLYSIKAYHHKLQMQNLYEIYIRSQWDNRNTFQKAVDTATPVAEDIATIFFSLPGPNVLKGIYRLFSPSPF